MQTVETEVKVRNPAMEIEQCNKDLDTDMICRLPKIPIVMDFLPRL